MSQIHALAIDDNQRNLKVLTQLLDRQGITTTEVYDSSTLEDVLASMPEVSVVFIDLEMPNGSGYDVLKWLRERLGGVPMIAYTVHVSEIRATQKMGFDGFIAKPIDNARFPEQIARILRGESVWEQG